MDPTLDLSLTQTAPAQLQQAIEKWIRTTSVQPATSVQPVVRDAATLRVKVTGAAGQPYIGAGLQGLQEVRIEGSVGNYACCGMEDCECTVDGDADEFLGHSMVSGVLVVTGSAGGSVGAMGTGGLIAIYGHAGDRAAISLRGTDVLIRGNAGQAAGWGMRQGTLVIGGSTGPELGCGMRGGTIYVRGEPSSISSDIEEQRLREPDRLKLGLLLLKAGMKATAGKDFRVFRARKI